MRDDGTVGTGASAPDLVTASLALVLPDEPVPVRLMNTIWADRFGVYDALTTPANLRAWLAAAWPDDPAPAPDLGDLDQFRALRDGVRRVAALLTHDVRPTAASATSDINQAVADVNHAAAQAPTWPQLAYHDGQLQRATAGHATATQHALTKIAQHSINLFVGDDRIKLRACNAPGCVLYFVKDHPRREWCSTACGNRARAARHYQRHHKNPADA
jgi:predicted RNA-binding Zn ribbon-like protein